MKITRQSFTMALPDLAWMAFALVGLQLSACGGGKNTVEPLDPDTAPRAEVDRFSAAAGNLFVRDADNGLPAAAAPIDFDSGPFITRGLGPGGELVRYYNFDVMPTEPAPIYALFRDGESDPVDGQLNVVGVIPGDAGYNDFWRVNKVTVPADYVANTITSVTAIQAGGYPVEQTDTIVNCPIVPDGSTATMRGGEADPGLTMGWYQDQVVFYFNFFEHPLMVDGQGQVPLSPIYVAFNVNPGEDGGGPPSGFVTEQGTSQTHNVLATLPADQGYSPLWDVNVYDNADFDSVSDLDSAMAADILATDVAMVNCPVVSVESPPMENAISVSDQSLEDLSTMVSVDSVTSLGPGWVVIHADDSGSPGEVIGHAAVEEGDGQGVQVALMRPAMDGETLFAMLHVDAGMVGTYEFPGADVPATGNGGEVVVESFVVTVPAGTPAVRVTISASDNNDYDFVSAEPDAFAQDIGAGEKDPAITLYTGWRYEIVNQVPVVHPFELIMQGATPAQDAVVLSQSADGSLEGDAGIDWYDDGDMTIRFTATGDLAAAVDGYRCSVHTSTMRGDVMFE